MFRENGKVEKAPTPHWIGWSIVILGAIALIAFDYWIEH